VEDHGDYLKIRLMVSVGRGVSLVIIGWRIGLITRGGES
jgi:hypothetical protein